MDYYEFLDAKTQTASMGGFEPIWMPSQAFDFQQHLIDWAVRKGRGGLFVDTGLGKTLMELAWAENVVRKTNKPVLLLTPLAVASQACREAAKFGIECHSSPDGSLLSSSKIVVANYERLHRFDPSAFSGVACDESGILKNYGGATRKKITRFISKMKYRLLASATPAPNDYVELGTSSEALGELSHSEMLKMFFRQLDDKGQKGEQRQQDEAERLMAHDGNYFQKLAYRVAQTIGQWRLKHHAVVPFWKWVASWCRACRMPSDLGFDNSRFILPEMIETDHIIRPIKPPKGFLFNVPAFGLKGEREERRRTLKERCEFAASLVSHKEQAVIWCHMNDEGDMLEKIIPDAKQIAGKTSDERKLELYDAFGSGELRVLVIKPKIGAWGLNWQHCSNVVTFVSHSYEQHYQLARRCYRFGQTKQVKLDVIATEGEARVLGNLRRKSEKASRMFESLILQMNDAESQTRDDLYTKKMESPSWL